MIMDGAMQCIVATLVVWNGFAMSLVKGVQAQDV